jgi:hypothetical protein
VRQDRTDPISYRTPEAGDHPALRAMARRSFTDTLGHLYDPGPFGASLDGAYGPGGTMARDLGDPAVRRPAALHAAAPVGYAQLTPLRAPAPAPARSNSSRATSSARGTAAGWRPGSCDGRWTPRPPTGPRRST